MKFLKTLSLSLALAVGAGAMANAATIATGATSVGDVAGINAVGATSIASNNSAYFAGATTPASQWVWISNQDSANDATYEFKFDLTGYNLSTVSLSGLWGVDNTGTVKLNDTLLASLPTVITRNFNVLHDYGATSGFLAGMNTLTFTLRDEGGQAAFRATAVVTGDLAAVPLPAGGLLLIGALGMLVLRRRMA